MRKRLPGPRTLSEAPLSSQHPAKYAVVAVLGGVVWHQIIADQYQILALRYLDAITTSTSYKWSRISLNLDDDPPIEPTTVIHSSSYGNPTTFSSSWGLVSNGTEDIYLNLFSDRTSIESSCDTSRPSISDARVIRCARAVRYIKSRGILCPGMPVAVEVLQVALHRVLALFEH